MSARLAITGLGHEGDGIAETVGGPGVRAVHALRRPSSRRRSTASGAGCLRCSSPARTGWPAALPAFRHLRRLRRAACRAGRLSRLEARPRGSPLRPARHCGRRAPSFRSLRHTPPRRFHDRAPGRCAGARLQPPRKLRPPRHRGMPTDGAGHREPAAAAAHARGGGGGTRQAGAHDRDRDGYRARHRDRGRHHARPQRFRVSTRSVAEGWLARLTIDGTEIATGRQPRNPPWRHGALSGGGRLPAGRRTGGTRRWPISSMHRSAQGRASTRSVHRASAPTPACARRFPVLAVENDADLLKALDRSMRFSKGIKTVTTRRRDLMLNPMAPPELKPFKAVVFDPPRAGAKAQCESAGEIGGADGSRRLPAIRRRSPATPAGPCSTAATA